MGTNSSKSSVREPIDIPTPNEAIRLKHAYDEKQKDQMIAYTKAEILQAMKGGKTQVQLGSQYQKEGQPGA